MKKILLLLLFCTTAWGQQKMETPMQTVKRIHHAYITQSETALSENDRQQMESALQKLQKLATAKDFPLLINVWMYFDPTDFPTRDLIVPILRKNKIAAIKAIDQSLAKKESCETKHAAPCSELFDQKESLTK